MSLPKPYYEDEAVTIYHGDCAEILPKLGSSCLLLTDPPYGIGADSRHASAASRDKNHGWKKYHSSGWDSSRPDDEVWGPLLAAAEHHIIWGGNYFADLLPASQCWLVWDKGQRGFSLADAELAWTSFDNASRVKTIARATANREPREHPTEKPVSLMMWCINEIAGRYAKRMPVSIIDPFAGSGTTLRAAKTMGIRAIGIEIEEKYCEIAAKRMAQEVLPL